MPELVPNFTNSMLNRVAQRDMSILGEEHDFMFTERVDNVHWNALIVASAKGYLDLVNRLLDIPEVMANAAADGNGALMGAAEGGHLDVVDRLLEIPEVKVVNRLRLLNRPVVMTNAAAYDNWALGCAAGGGHRLGVVNRLLDIPEVMTNAAAKDNKALRLAAEKGYSEVVHALAQAQWPLGRMDMPKEMHQYLPLIKAGAQLYSAKKEQERILLSALQNKSVLSTRGLYAPSSLGYDLRANRLFTLLSEVVASIASYAGYRGQYLAEQIRKDHWQNAWNDMRRSERLYGLFTKTNKTSREEQRELVTY